VQSITWAHSYVYDVEGMEMLGVKLAVRDCKEAQNAEKARINQT